MTRRRLTSQSGPLRCGIDRPVGRQPRSYEAVVERFLAERDGETDQEISFYKGQRTLEGTIEIATLSIYHLNGKRHPHQTRIPGHVLERASVVLLAAKRELQNAGSFDGVFAIVESRIGGIAGVGEMLIYDVAHRIGEYMGLPPDSVYLHRGTRKGALAMGLGRGRKKLLMSEFPAPFRRLSPVEMEDCLCICKDELAAVHRQPE